MLSTIIIALQTLIVCVLCLAVHLQKKQIKVLEKMYREEWYRGINGEVQSNLWKEKHDKLAEILEIKETRIKDLESSLEEKSWAMDKLEDDLVVSQRHVNELKNELTQTHIMFENQISVNRLCRNA